MIIEKIPDIQRLTPKEKAILAKELWAEAGDVDFRISEDSEHAMLIEERWQEFLSDPESSVSWDSVKRKIDLRFRND
jgi:hypothetical protein